MKEYSNQYPLKIVSRVAEINRLRRLRLSWIAAGAAFAFGCTSALTPLSILPSNLSIAFFGTTSSEDTIIEPQDFAVLESIVNAAPVELLGSEVPPTVLADNTQPVQLSSDETTDQNNQETNTETKVVASVSEDIIPKTDTQKSEPKKTETKNLELKVKKGSTVASLLNDAGFAQDEIQNVTDSLKKAFNNRRLDVGGVVKVKAIRDTENKLRIANLTLPASVTSTIELSKNDNGEFDVKKSNVPVYKKLAHAGGVIENSIYQTGADVGIPSSMLNELITAYSYDVDFQRDVKKGASIDVLFERMETKDGTVVGNGNFVFSELNLGNRSFKIYRYTDKNGNADFYNEKGESVRKSLLRTPVNGVRITSGYGMREHPIHGYNKMHRGVDFGAPIGTPIYAAGDGVVESATVKSGYGNYLKIKHTGKYSTAYAHLSRFAAGVSPGKRVKQGQIVAYVGNTGASTGPHLHYEVLVNNEQVNPANVKFKTGNVLQGKELAQFKAKMDKLESRLASIGRGNTVAMADEPATNKTKN